mgnify:CR=1 FL=1
MARACLYLLLLTGGFTFWRCPGQPRESDVEATRLAALRAGAAILREHGMDAAEAQAVLFLAGGRCEFHDLEWPDNPHNPNRKPWRALDAAFLPGNPATDSPSRICWNLNTVRYMAPRHLATIWLDELSHAGGRADHEESDAQVLMLVARWEAARGLRWGEVAPGEEAWARYIREGYWWRRAARQRNNAALDWALMVKHVLAQTAIAVWWSSLVRARHAPNRGWPDHTPVGAPNAPWRPVSARWRGIVRTTRAWHSDVAGA